MKWISLDLSSKTGFAVYENEKLIDYGLISVPILDFKSDVSNYAQLPSSYPENLISSAARMAEEISHVICKNNVRFAIIEHTEGSQRRFSQRYLEWLHLCMLMKLKKQKVRYRYLLNSDWRSATNCYLKHRPELAKWNKQVKKAKDQATPTKSGAKVAKIEGKIVTKIDGKQLSIIIANETYGLSVVDDNIADALNLGSACLKLNLLP